MALVVLALLATGDSAELEAEQGPGWWREACRCGHARAFHDELGHGACAYRGDRCACVGFVEAEHAPG
ncbi:hypothetical protein [Polyangium sorediatum]|uniref:Uncharacterized protein n=1 Tax=Polyangium sorediatum TaxID=889274 RepID=A0ABT6NL70_9BACT|nr:hypothetical protein [Polyangium sorediatum]MDI1429049.1 hypothetical protein [Polyangium sorediatum]